MVERVTSNDEVAGSIPSEGIQATSNQLFAIFLFLMVVVEWVKRGRFCKLFCNVVRILAGCLAWSFSERERMRTRDKKVKTVKT
jgi:hypothetical protein